MLKKMNKPSIAILGDLHFSHSGHSHDKFEQQMDFIENQFFPYLIENNIKTVFQLGDVFHDRNRADWFILNELKKRFFGWFDENNINIHILCGNHDTYFKSTLEHNSLSETAQEFSNVHIYIKPTKIKCGSYVIGINPWIIDNSKPNLTENVDICLGHFNVMGLPMMKGINSRDGIQYDTFKKYKLVLSGHFHIRTIVDNFHMIGSPFQLNWGDYNQARGFIVLDDKFNFEYIQNSINPQFVKIYYDDGNISSLGFAPYTDVPTIITKEEALLIAKHNYCRIFTRGIEDQLEFEAFYNSLLQVSLNDYKIDSVSLNEAIEEYDSTEFDVSFEEGESTIQLILSSIDGMVFDKSIDKNLLLSLAKVEYKNAHQEVIGAEE